MPVFERNLVAPEDFDLAAGRAIEFYLPDVGTDLHPVGPGVHTQRATHRAGYANQTFHAAQVIFRTEGYRASQVRHRIDLSEGAVDDHLGLGLGQLQHDPWQFPVSDQQVRPSPDKPVGDAISIEQIKQIWNALVLFDAQEVGGAANSERSEVGERRTAAQLDSQLRQRGNNLGVFNAHGL